MLKAADVARQLGLSARAVYDLADRGLLLCHRMGAGRGAVRFDPVDVEAYRNSAAAKPATPHLPAKVLRLHEKLRRLAVAAGEQGIPRLSPEQQAIADSRYRRDVLAPWAGSSAVTALRDEARRLSVDTGVPHHVDHVIPLQGDFVSGLHVETNMQILPAVDNLRKRNRFEPC